MIDAVRKIARAMATADGYPEPAWTYDKKAETAIQVLLDICIDTKELHTLSEHAAIRCFLEDALAREDMSVS